MVQFDLYYSVSTFQSIHHIFSQKNLSNCGLEQDSIKQMKLVDICFANLNLTEVQSQRLTPNWCNFKAGVVQGEWFKCKQMSTNFICLIESCSGPQSTTAQIFFD